MLIYRQGCVSLLNHGSTPVALLNILLLALISGQICIKDAEKFVGEVL